MATIKDIAERTGVTPTTVSRVVNNRGYVSEKTRAKVEQAMKELDYQPNALARALVKKHTNTIGMIVPQINHPFFCWLIDCVEEAASERGYRILLCNSHEKPEKEAEFMDMFISNKVSGVILCSKHVQVEKFKSLNIPVICFEREEDNAQVISILGDNYYGGRLAARHLIEKGCKNLMFFGGRVGDDIPDDKRAKGFCDECDSRGIAHIEVQSEKLTHKFEDYEECIRESIRKHEYVDGVFAGGDMIAAKVIQEYKLVGKSVPEDVKVVGFDDSMIATVATPTITTLRQPIKEMAELSIEYILKVLKNKMVPMNTVLPVELIKRQST